VVAMYCCTISYIGHWEKPDFVILVRNAEDLMFGIKLVLSHSERNLKLLKNLLCTTCHFFIL
jgi:hypothetical protein